MAEPINVEEFRAIFGVETDNTEDSDGSDIDFEGFSVEQDEFELAESDAESERSDESSESGEEVWSERLQDFVLEDFTGTQQINANVPVEAKSDFY